MLPSVLVKGTAIEFTFSRMRLRGQVLYAIERQASVKLNDGRLGRSELQLFDDFAAVYDIKVLS